MKHTIVQLFMNERGGVRGRIHGVNGINLDFEFGRGCFCYWRCFPLSRDPQPSVQIEKEVRFTEASNNIYIYFPFIREKVQQSENGMELWTIEVPHSLHIVQRVRFTLHNKFKTLLGIDRYIFYCVAEEWSWENVRSSPESDLNSLGKILKLFF